MRHFRPTSLIMTSTLELKNIKDDLLGCGMSRTKLAFDVNRMILV